MYRENGRISKKNYGNILLLFCFFLFFNVLWGDDSLNWKEEKAKFHRERLLYPPDFHRVYRQLLEQKSKEGDSIAQHELSIRYLTGKGLTVDTAKSAFWMGKSAETNFVSALYNYGIFLNSGIGVEWNPFEAYHYVKMAADSGMAQGQFVFGLFHTDNLIVKRDYDIAYEWIKKAADQNFEPAVQIAEELKRRGLVRKDSIGGNHITDSPSVSFNSRFELNVSEVDYDSLFNQENDRMIQEILDLNKAELFNKVKVSEFFLDSMEKYSNLEIVQSAAENGSPEALLILGRCLQRGISVPENEVSAAACYLKAKRLGATKADMFLRKISMEHDIFYVLKKEINKKNPEAMYVRSGLSAFNLDYSITEEESFQLLLQSKQLGYIDGYIELGICFYTGNMTEQSVEKALLCWEEASGKGNLEGKIRIISHKIFNQPDLKSMTNEIDILMESVNKGSVLAQSALAYCYNNGIGTNKNQGKAAELYRDASYRGSQTAFLELKKMNDSIRPDEPKFFVE